jgi:hypothetical protein
MDELNEFLEDLESLSETDELLRDTIDHMVKELGLAREAILMKNKVDYIAHLEIFAELFNKVLNDPDIINPDEADAFALDSKIREYREFITTFTTSKFDIVGLSTDDPTSGNFKQIL